MKKLLLSLTVICLFASSVVKAGKNPEFKTVWEGAFPFTANLYAAADPKGERVLGSQQNEFCLIDGNTGKLLWHHKFKDVSEKQITVSNFQMVLWEANILLVFDNKLGKDRVAAFDLKDGKMLWIKDKYKWPKPGKEGKKSGVEDMIIYIPEIQAFAFTQKESLTLIKVKTGEEVWETTRFKGSIGTYMYEEGDLIMINYKPTVLAALFTGFKNQLVRINPKNGEIKWETTYLGVVEKEFITRKPIVSLTKKDNRIFMELQGLQVFDFNTGQSLWNSTYESDLDARRALLASYTTGKVMGGALYGAIAEPQIIGNHVYIVISGGNKNKSKFVKKLDIETGKELWMSEEIEAANAMPEIVKVGDRIVCQIGGFVNLQAMTREKKKTENGYEFIIHRYNKNVWVGRYAVAAIDDKTGKFAWRSEKFKKRIANMTVDGNTIYTASGKSYYSIDAVTGKENYFIEKMTDAKVGKGLFTVDIGEAVAVICDKGIVAYNKKDGKQRYASKAFRGVEGYVVKGDNIFLQNDKADIAGIIYESGTIKGAVNAKTSKWSENEKFVADSEFEGGVDMTDDGEYIYVFKRKDIVKLKVNK